MNSADRPINFTRGVPADESFPLHDIANCAAAVLSGTGGAQVLQYGPSRGYAPLRQWLAERHGVGPDQIMLGNGSLQLVDFMGLGLLQPGDLVFVESPTYDRTLTLLRRHGIRVVGVPLETDGPDLAAFEAALQREVPRLCYLIPDFQNPSGATMSLPKRQRIAELAQQYDFLILEDAPYRPLRYRGQDVPGFLSLVPDRTLHMSSFSKQIGPSVRVGYMIGDEEILSRLAKVAEDTYITPNLVAQATVYEFCRRGLLDPQLERLRELYGTRLAAIGAALRSYLPGAEWIEPDGGFFLSITLPEGSSGEDLRRRAAEAQLNLSDGRGFFPDPADGERFLRLPFCALTPAQIDDGVRRLAALVSVPA